MPHSDRGTSLVITNQRERTRPLLTVEFYVKWYTLCLVFQDGSVKTVGYDELEPYTPNNEAAYVDHVPNPSSVKNFAEKKNYDLDELAYELIVGRWAIEVKELF